MSGRLAIAALGVFGVLVAGGCSAQRTPSDPARATLPVERVPSAVWPEGPVLPACEVVLEDYTEIRVLLEADDRTITVGPSERGHRPVDRCEMIPLGSELVQFFGGFEPEWTSGLRTGEAPVLMHVLHWHDASDELPNLCAWREHPPMLVQVEADRGQFFRVYPPAGAPRGVAIVFEGLGIQFTSRKWVERRLIEELRGRGWMVLAGVMAPAPDSALFVGSGVRFGDQITSVDRRDLLAKITDHYVEAFDARGAALADSTRAALAVIERKVPAVVGTPRVMVGISMGAIMLPTTAARLDPPPAAAVFVGGGSNIAHIANASEFGRQFVELQVFDNTPLSEEERRSIELGYLARSRLDPAMTAAALTDRPVLVVDASNDKIVPPASADLLWERLGKPERWTYPFGHMRLMLQMRWIGDDIADWLDAALEAQDQQPEAQTPGV